MTPPDAPNLVLRAWREARGLTRPQMADALNGAPAGQHGQILCHPKLLPRLMIGHLLAGDPQPISATGRTSAEQAPPADEPITEG